MIKLLKILLLTVGMTVLSCSTPDNQKLNKTYNRIELRNDISKHVVKVMGISGGHGSGFSVIHNDKNFIITNAHVCEMAEDGKLLVQYAYSSHKYVATVYKIDDSHDLCAINSVRGFFSSGLTVADRYPHVGETLHSLGYPSYNNLTMSSGEYTGFSDVELQAELINGKCLGELRTFQTIFGEFEACVRVFPAYELTTAVYPGSSGSVLFNDYGKVVGVIFAKSTKTHISNYAVPLEYLKSFLRRL